MKASGLLNPVRYSLEWVKIIGSFCPNMSYNGYKKSSQHGRNMRYIAWILFVLAAVTLFSLQQVEGGPAEVTLIHTSNVTGHLFPCPS